ncbi:HlyD family secretion protein [Massilia genomosp. 1]|uniref:HlyD family efflux transporter periplasmic adaptor subunit n=1 Tax=Massilia genomosp. 1 TaxID=2609280 RepID=A0ABX0N255_9BURK|nr:HlyD family efflux transporter periplasmic adaptor subunit [Massilia genomosp. 1]NHZ66516.1 HlyD family efflux transporter periplasmic adaptor subunit [Massilia genomosp. 1]
MVARLLIDDWRDKTMNGEDEPSPEQLAAELFRHEARLTDVQRLGAPVMPAALSQWALTTFLVALFGVAAWFVCTTRYAHKETVIGQVTPAEGALRIMATKSGVAERVLVNEGDHVRAGQVLMFVSSAPKLEHGESLAGSLRANQLSQLDLQASQASARRDQLLRQREEIGAHRKGIVIDLAQIAGSIRLQKERVAIQEKTVVAAQTLGAQGMMPALTVHAKENDLIASRQLLNALSREKSQQESTLEQLRIQHARLGAELRLVVIDAAQIAVKEEEKRLTSEATYADNPTAPRDGVVSALQVKNGTPVSPNQSLAVIVPSSTNNGASALELELWAPSRAIGMVRTGAKVKIMYDAFPYQVFGVGEGEVRFVSNAPVLPNELPIPTEAKEQLYKIRVALQRDSLSAYGKRWPLAPGMRVTADLVLEERSLLDWLLDPLHAMQRRSGDDVASIPPLSIDLSSR